MSSSTQREIQAGRASVITATITYRRQTTLAAQQALGPALRPLREEWGSLRQFAKHVGVNVSTMSRFERGYDTNVSDVLKILKGLGCFICGPDTEEIAL